MSQKHPLLTIAIPTYNRGHVLPKTVLFFIQNILENNLQDKVTLLVSDNASPDNTSEELAKIKLTYPSLITCHRQSENVGYANNVLWLLENCQTPYIWTVGDDDIYNPRALPTIIKNLETENLDVLFLNCEYPCGSKYKLGIKETQEYMATLEEIIPIPNDQVTYMSCNVAKTDLLKNAPYSSPTWILFDKIIHFQPNCKAKFLPQPFIRYASADVKNNWKQNPECMAKFVLEFLNLLLTEKENSLVKGYWKKSSESFLLLFVNSFKLTGIYNKNYKKIFRYKFYIIFLITLSIALLFYICYLKGFVL